MEVAKYFLLECSDLTTLEDHLTYEYLNYWCWNDWLLTLNYYLFILNSDLNLQTCDWKTTSTSLHYKQIIFLYQSSSAIQSINACHVKVTNTTTVFQALYQRVRWSRDQLIIVAELIVGSGKHPVKLWDTNRTVDVFAVSDNGDQSTNRVQQLQTCFHQHSQNKDFAEMSVRNASIEAIQL